MSFYRDWGFKQNPFDTHALPANSEGHRLLVGRDHVVEQLKERLASGRKIVTVEGLNGVGKTSVVNVMSYLAYENSKQGDEGDLFLPCDKVFQLDGNKTAEEFRREVFLSVGQTLVSAHSYLTPKPGYTKPHRVKSTDRFLNSPQVKGVTLGLQGLALGVSQETNTGFGFEYSGFEKNVKDWLREAFEGEGAGGVVCVIDNLELLQTSQNAREKIESLRDSLLNVEGLRWVLCGANGIIHGVASSPRMEGRLKKPITIDDLDPSFAPLVFSSRQDSFKVKTSAKLPLDADDFMALFGLLRGNIRSVLSECDEFCQWVAEEVGGPENFESSLFSMWLEHELEIAYAAVRFELRPAAMRVFKKACELEVFSPSDCEEFGYDTPMALRPQIKSLETVGVLVSAVEDGDKRRKSIIVTPKGWKVKRYLELHAET